MAPQRHTTRVIPTLSTCARREPVLSRIRRNSGPRITRRHEAKVILSLADGQRVGSIPMALNILPSTT